MLDSSHREMVGAPGRNRTRDLRFRKPLLYQLSYKGNLRILVAALRTTLSIT